jgi:ABC-type sugar transport system ATPase subunit
MGDAGTRRLDGSRFSAEAAAVSAVSYQDIPKSFAAFTAIRALNLALSDRTFLALLGPSGCGKTTALRILAGLETPSSGRVLIGERDVTRLQPRDRDVAMVFQSYALYPHMTIVENIGYRCGSGISIPPRARRRSPKSQRPSRSVIC